MREIRIDTIVNNDGELHLKQLPCKKGDHITALVTIASKPTGDHREIARQSYIALAKQSMFASTSSYPRRDELHARELGV